MFKDGSMAWDAKNYLIKQDKCKEVVIENNTYHGPAAKEKVNNSSRNAWFFHRLLIEKSISLLAG